MKTTTTCRHAKKNIFTVTMPYNGSIYRAEKTNPAAHGGYTEIQSCTCGALRSVNVNGNHIEKGRWSL